MRRGLLTVSTMVSFAANWLVPRLGRYRALNPEIDVRITTSDFHVDFARQDVDLAIRYGRGGWPGLDAVRLMTEEVVPGGQPRPAGGRAAASRAVGPGPLHAYS